MSPGLGPIVVELCITLLFCGVLIYLRKSLTPTGLAFWIFLWLARGAASLFALQYMASTERLMFIFYAPLQIAFSIALVIIAVRLESQKGQLRDMGQELTRLRKEAAARFDFDPLTGLRNRAALERWMEEQEDFPGLIVVCDLDDFKLLNDQYGHVAGDEILHGFGKLIRKSIREEDLAFRWGGDEFVIFFSTSDVGLVGARLQGIEEHLLGFHIRHHGTIPVHFSWGLTTASGRPLRESLAEADRLMYEIKRGRRVAQPSEEASAGA